MSFHFGQLEEDYQKRKCIFDCSKFLRADKVRMKPFIHEHTKHKHRGTRGTSPLQSQPLCTSPVPTTPLRQTRSPPLLPPTPTSLLSIRVVCFKPQLHPRHPSPSMVKFKAPLETHWLFLFFSFAADSA